MFVVAGGLIRTGAVDFIGQRNWASQAAASCGYCSR